MIENSQVLYRNKAFLMLQVQSKIEMVSVLEEALAVKDKNPNFGRSRCLKAAIRKNVEKILNKEERERIIRTNAYRSFVKQQTKKAQEFIDKMKRLS